MVAGAGERAVDELSVRPSPPILRPVGKKKTQQGAGQNARLQKLKLSEGSKSLGIVTYAATMQGHGSIHFLQICWIHQVWFNLNYTLKYHGIP